MAHRTIRAGRAVSVSALLPLGLAVSACVGSSTNATGPNTPPSASFIFNPAAPITAGETEVTFNASSSQDPDGSISQYIWDFGDGSPVATLGAAATTHVFVDSPITCDVVVYTVQLTVVDDQGARSSTADQVEVLELPDPRVVQCVPGSD